MRILSFCNSASKKYRRDGFTLIEILIAISVLIVGIVGVYAIVPRIVGVTAENRDEFIASQLAQEGLEIVRNMRDSNWLRGVAWDSGLNNCSSGCEIDYNDASFSSYADRFLKIDNNGFYNYDSGEDTKFKRKITITPSSNVLDVKVEIFWSGKGSPFQIEEKLYRWYNYNNP